MDLSLTSDQQALEAALERQPVPLADAPTEAAVPPAPAPEEKPALIKH